jgi:hypothetical protein
MANSTKAGRVSRAWQAVKAARGVKRATLFLVFIVVAFVFAVVPILGGWVDAWLNLLTALKWLRGILVRTEALTPFAQFLLIIVAAAALFVVIRVIDKKARLGPWRGPLSFLAILSILAILAILISRRPPNSALPINSKIAITVSATVTADERLDVLLAAIERAKAAAEQFAATYPTLSKRGERRLPPEITLVKISDRLRAKEEILDRLRREEFGYLILAAQPEDLNYAELLDTLNDEVVTFVVRPAPISGDERSRSVILYPPPEREGEWMAQNFLRLGLDNITLMYRNDSSSDFERRCKDTFHEVLSRSANIHPARVYDYSSVEELRARIDDQRQSPSHPAAIYIIDSSPMQTVALEALADFRGNVAFTSRLLDYADPRTTSSIDLEITIPWPMELYLAKALRTGFKAPSIPEKETITGAAAYSALLISDFIHHDVETLAREELESKLLGLPAHFGYKDLLPLGPIRFHSDSQLSKSEISVSIWRKARNVATR